MLKVPADLPTNCVEPDCPAEKGAETISGDNVNRDELSFVGQAVWPISANLRGRSAAKDPARAGRFPYSYLDHGDHFYG